MKTPNIHMKSIRRLHVGCAVGHLGKANDLHDKFISSSEFRGLVYYCAKCEKYYTNNQKVKKVKLSYQGKDILYSDRCVVAIRTPDNRIHLENLTDHNYSYYDEIIRRSSRGSNSHKKSKKKKERKSTNKSGQNNSKATNQSTPVISAKSSSTNASTYLERPVIKADVFPGQMRSLLVCTDSNNQCPFCHHTITEQKPVNVVVYDGMRPDHGVYFNVLYCEICDVPFANLNILDFVLTTISPYRINTFPADIFNTADESLDACYERVNSGEFISYIRNKNELRKARKRQIKFSDFDPTKRKNSSVQKQTVVHKLPFAPPWEEKIPVVSGKTLYVYKNKCRCRKCERKYPEYRAHIVVNRAAYVKTQSGEQVKINVQFCEGCGEYFMNIESLIEYEQLYGKLDCNLSYTYSYYDSFDQFEDFAQSSVLSRNGYNVRKGTSQIQRQAILGRILDYGLATKSEIIDLLTQNIQFARKRLPDACRRWEEDILFVNQYRIDEQDNAGLLKMKQGGKISWPDD